MASPKSDRRAGERVKLERGFPVQIMGIDGTWRRGGKLEDVSETGATLSVEASEEGLNLKDFFLLLSSTGLAYRRCELAWVNGVQMGVCFLSRRETKKKQPSTFDR
jgi:PilZ domain